MVCLLNLLLLLLLLFTLPVLTENTAMEVPVCTCACACAGGLSVSWPVSLVRSGRHVRTWKYSGYGTSLKG
ncbi:MAG: hypothetical protein J3R72DRAFT_443668 [Linnemannia gamsii]|nr:MAG: hypothetical protein J3R72DRAFT_443668 [Linnemannia gamsii]